MIYNKKDEIGVIATLNGNIIRVWPPSWTPAVGGLIVCVCACVSG